MIKPYYLTMSDWDKDFTTKVFKISRIAITKYMMFIATNVYDIDVNNPNI